MKVNKNIKIRSVSIQSYKGVDDVTIDCSKPKKTNEVFQWTVLLANNNTGKTRILQAIADMRPVNVSNINPQIFNLDQARMDQLKNFDLMIPYITGMWATQKENNNTAEIECNLTNDIKWMGSNLTRHISLVGKEILNNFRIFGYGVSRYPSTNYKLSKDDFGDCDTLFSHGKRLINIEEWLMQLDYAVKSNNQVMKKRLEKVREVICSNIFPEIDDFKFESTNTNNCVLFKTKDGWFRYNELGFGYQSMLSWVVDLCKRMFETFPKSKNPLLESAIVLVDEIDLHLHPKWQREIISYVSEIFKNVQFIVTTHSPLIIQSMQEVNLYVLRREDEKIVVEHSPVTNFSGWTVEEILSETMNLGSDIQSIYLQESYKMFDEGLDNNDINKAQEAYNTLIKILHPNNPARRLLKLQLDKMEIDD